MFLVNKLKNLSGRTATYIITLIFAKYKVTMLESYMTTHITWKDYWREFSFESADHLDAESSSNQIKSILSI